MNHGIIDRFVTCAKEGCNAKCLPPHTLCGRHRKPPTTPRAPKAPTLFRKKRSPEAQDRRARRLYGLETL